MDEVSGTSRARLGAPALRAFFNIAERWQLDERQQALVLGVEDLETLRSWKARSQAGDVASLPNDTLERLGYVFGIFKAINILLPLPDRADRWMRAPNTAPVFSGRSAINRMTDGAVGDLRAVHQYLATQVDGCSPDDAVLGGLDVSS